METYNYIKNNGVSIKEHYEKNLAFNENICRGLNDLDIYHW